MRHAIAYMREYIHGCMHAELTSATPHFLRYAWSSKAGRIRIFPSSPFHTNRWRLYRSPIAGEPQDLLTHCHDQDRRVVCLSCTDEGAHHDHQRNTEIGQYNKSHLSKMSISSVVQHLECLARSVERKSPWPTVTASTPIITRKHLKRTKKAPNQNPATSKTLEKSNPPKPRSSEKNLVSNKNLLYSRF